MAIHVNWAYKAEAEPIWLTEIQRAAAQTLRHGGYEPDAVDVVILLTDRATVHALNRQYRGYDKPTDVLAFPDGSHDPETGRPYLGDVVIAVPVAAEQAQQAGHTLADELCLLTVHGVLHLLGYDDQEPQARARMWAQQGAILQELACRATMPPL
ncbi:MAG: rRNA maturation RNase YbeY [Chloroflexi bacterium]|nr:rRNA maturation RNase YbeY [Chloroflexota bacterium]